MLDFDVEDGYILRYPMWMTPHIHICPATVIHFIFYAPFFNSRATPTPSHTHMSRALI